MQITEYNNLLDRWLALLNFRAGKINENKQIFYLPTSNVLKNRRSATIILKDEIPKNSDLGIFTQHSKCLFDLASDFYKKNKREFKESTSFIALIIFISTSFNEDVWNHFLNNKPGSKSYSGTYIPVLVNLTDRTLAYFTSGNISESQRSIVNPLDNQLNLLFQIPMNPPAEIKEPIIQIINFLRQPKLKSNTNGIENLDSMTFGELKRISNQFLFDGLMQTDGQFSLKLLYSTYIDEVFIILESKKEIPATTNFSLQSLLSVDNFVLDLATSFESSFMNAFNKVVYSGTSMDEIQTIRKRLIEQGHAIAVAECKQCGKWVKLNHNLICPNSRFHKTGREVFFDTSEEPSIKNLFDYGDANE